METQTETSPQLQFDASHIDSLTEKEAAERIGISKVSLSNHRKNGTGPDWYVLPDGFHIRYRVVDIVAWINKLLAHPDKFRKPRTCNLPGRQAKPVPFEETPIGQAIADADATAPRPTLSAQDRSDLEEALTAEQPGPVAAGSSFNPAELDHE